MEDVLEVYHRPYNPRRPQVCLDETNRQLVRETRTPIPAAPGRPATMDYEYERNGTVNLFMMFEPLAGRRHVLVTERRTAKDYAHAIRHLLDVVYSEAEKVVLVQDNLNTHKRASLYEAFPPEEVRRLCDRLEVHYTPKHGSWRRCLATRPQRRWLPRELAIHHRRRTHQTPTPLPNNRTCQFQRAGPLGHDLRPVSGSAAWSRQTPHKRFYPNLPRFRPRPTFEVQRPSETIA